MTAALARCWREGCDPVLEDERVRALSVKGKNPNDTKGWVEAFDEVFSKGFPEAIIAGFPKSLGYSETSSRSEAGSES